MQIEYTALCPACNRDSTWRDTVGFGDLSKTECLCKCTKTHSDAERKELARLVIRR